MNELLQIKIPFGHIGRKAHPGQSILPANQSVTSEKLKFLVEKLKSQVEFWQNQTVISDALICIEYTRVVSKSNRIRQLLKFKGEDLNECIKGARFVGDDKTKRHVITYNVSIASIIKSVSDLKNAIFIVENDFNGSINCSNIEAINMMSVNKWPYSDIAKSVFVNLIVDCFYIKDIYTPFPDKHSEGSSIVTIYNTNFSVSGKLKELGIVLEPDKILNEYTVVLTEEQYKLLNDRAPFLIAMSLTDITKIAPFDYYGNNSDVFTIGKPSNEPTIGVIDTFFENNVYFSEWVEVHNEIPELGITDEDRVHGTAIDSLIVDGARINPELNDGCGNFKVRHFSCMTANGYNSINLIKSIKKIVKENRDIKVWNISLGSDYQTHENFISYEAAELDKLQVDNDIIFVIAGTNDRAKTLNKRLGAPADSINAIVVNSVNRNKLPASYSRRGPVLSFYNKPDVSYYGGDKGEYIKVCSKNGQLEVLGTSFAAPYISRKLAYLIHVMGLSREVSKALIVDSTIGWIPNTTNNISSFIGMGIVPCHISDILQSQDDEIRFVFTGEATEYDNYCYSIPVPIVKGKQPYIAKATLCYFPSGFRDQGVDYTATELDLHFGRINNSTIQTINNNNQNTDSSREYEKDARNYHRKWDNTKVICESFKQRGRPKEVKQKGLWGISIKKTERNSKKTHTPIRFGMVVTLKNIEGENLIQDFVQQCAWNNLLVTPLKVNQKIDIYNRLSEEIHLE